MLVVPSRRGALVTPAEARRIVQRSATDLTSRSLRGMDATSASLRKADLTSRSLRAGSAIFVAVRVNPGSRWLNRAKVRRLAYKQIANTIARSY